jgi:hypothetical protein
MKPPGSFRPSYVRSRGTPIPWKRNAIQDNGVPLVRPQVE